MLDLASGIKKAAEQLDENLKCSIMTLGASVAQNINQTLAHKVHLASANVAVKVLCARVIRVMPAGLLAFGA